MPKPISNKEELVKQIQSLKSEGKTDKQIAEALGITIHRICYLRYWYGIGGHYEKYKKKLDSEPYL